jgi:tellurite methyltransferase
VQNVARGQSVDGTDWFDSNGKSAIALAADNVRRATRDGRGRYAVLGKIIERFLTGSDAWRTKTFTAYGDSSKRKKFSDFGPPTAAIEANDTSAGCEFVKPGSGMENIEAIGEQKRLSGNGNGGDVIRQLSGCVENGAAAGGAVNHNGGYGRGKILQIAKIGKPHAVLLQLLLHHLRPSPASNRRNQVRCAAQEGEGDGGVQRRSTSLSEKGTGHGFGVFRREKWHLVEEIKRGAAEEGACGCRCHLASSYPGDVPRNWDENFSQAELDFTPSPLVVEVAEMLGPGRALDLACGAGRNSLHLAALGWRIVAVDSSPNAIRILRERAAGLPIEIQLTDLEAGDFAIEPAGYDLICDILYLQLSLFPQIREGVRPGGVVAAEVLLADGRPHRFALEPGELRKEFTDWKILYYSESPPLGHTRATARIIARRA